MRTESARTRYVKANVKVRKYPDGTLAVFHGPRRLTRYTVRGQEPSDGISHALFFFQGISV